MTGELKRARLGVSVVFAVCGAAFATWLARVPAVQGRLGLSTGELATGLFGRAAGSGCRTPLMIADSTGTWTLGDLTVNRIGFGVMRLTQNGKAFAADAVSRDRDQAIAVLLGRDHLALVNLRVAGLREAGLIRHLGIAPVVCVQNAYGLGYRREQDAFLDTCGKQGHRVRAVPRDRRRRTGGGSGRRRARGGARHRPGARGKPVQVRLAWALRRGPNVLVIPGTGTFGHLEDNVAAGDLRLTPDEPAGLGAVHAASPER